jgi:hypothetical protein
VIAIVAATGIALAQEPESDDSAAAAARFRVPFADRECRFDEEDRDPRWAPSTEQCDASSS